MRRSAAPQNVRQINQLAHYGKSRGNKISNASTGNADEVASRNQLRKRMLEVVQTLPLPQKQAIILCLEGFSFREIGETMGISTHAAQMRCHRAKAALKTAMETLP